MNGIGREMMFMSYLNLIGLLTDSADGTWRLRVYADAVPAVAGSCRILINKPNLRIVSFPMFRVVALG